MLFQQKMLTGYILEKFIISWMKTQETRIDRNSFFKNVKLEKNIAWLSHSGQDKEMMA